MLEDLFFLFFCFVGRMLAWFLLRCVWPALRCVSARRQGFFSGNFFVLFLLFVGFDTFYFILSFLPFGLPYFTFTLPYLAHYLTLPCPALHVYRIFLYYFCQPLNDFLASR